MARCRDRAPDAPQFVGVGERREAAQSRPNGTRPRGATLLQNLREDGRICGNPAVENASRGSQCYDLQVKRPGGAPPW
jgi:hypothetical protein